ncbi:MAG: YcxB family protein, partial [Acidimicrobiales bacterium]
PRPGRSSAGLDGERGRGGDAGRGSSTAPVTVTFTLTEQEYRRAAFAASMRNPEHVLGPTMIGLGIVYASREWWIGLLAAVVTALMGIVLSPYLRWRRNPVARAEQTHTFTTTGAVVRSGGRSSSYNWSFYPWVRQIGGLYVLLHNTRQWNAVPERAFATPADEARFRTIVAAKTRASLRS